MAVSYSLYHPYGEWDRREYVIVVQEGYKTYGYMKLFNQPPKRQHEPETRGMYFVGYMKPKAFEEKLFMDSI